jgi:hypothetical protein
LRVLQFVIAMLGAEHLMIQLVMPGLVPGIHAFLYVAKSWMAGTSPAMTGQSFGREET